MDYSAFVYGGVSGMFGILISHPFDTIKTNIQQKHPIKFNVSNLYKGIIPPMIGVGIEKALVFGIYNSVKNNNTFEITDKTHTAIAGGCAGFGASFIVTPIERIKILLQINDAKKSEIYNVRHLFRGLSATFTRETPGFAIYFSTYEYLKNRHKKEITNYQSFLYGGMSGALAWTFIYPQDRIKTKMQAGTSDGFYKTMKSIYTEEGLKGYYRGFHLALMRAVPLHAGTFMMMEILNK